MSVTPPRSPPSTLNVDIVGDQPSKHELVSIMESGQDENLHIETDPLADNLDYEAEELDEQDEIPNVDPHSPVDHDGHFVNDFSSHETKVIGESQSSLEVGAEDVDNSSSSNYAAPANNDGYVDNTVDRRESTEEQLLIDSHALEGIKNGGAGDDILDTKLDGNENKETNASNAASEIANKALESFLEEELEEGEVSDEDEEARKERLKPQPVCRFYSKGACTWGSSCRFIHPGVLDTGRYSMFAQPKPILPGVEDEDLSKAGDEGSPVKSQGETSTTEEPNKSPVKGAAAAAMGTGVTAKPAVVGAQMAAIPKIETAWERGLRQAKEMKRRSQQRKETDVEYEEKRTNMSLTQAELDKENDYYMRQASPLHEPDDGTFGDDLEDVVVPDMSEAFKGRRRVAPPPPDDFRHVDVASMHGPVRRYPPLEPPLERNMRDRNYSPSPPPPKMRRAPPRSPPDMHDDIDSGAYPTGHRPNRPPNMRPDEWADPWMRGGPMGMHQPAGRGGHRHNEDSGPLAQRQSSSRNGRNESLQSPTAVGDDGKVQRIPRAPGRRRSYSSGSSHSSSSGERNKAPGALGSRSRSKNQHGRRGRRDKGERRRRSSGSSRTSGSSPSPHRRRNARSSSPEYIARKQGGAEIKRERNRSKTPNAENEVTVVRIKSEHGPRGTGPDGLIGSKSQAPLQKRLGAMAAGISLGPAPSGFIRNIKKENEDKRPGGTRSGGNANLVPLGPRPTPSPQKPPGSRRRRTTTRSTSAGSSSSREGRRSPSNRRFRRRSSGRRSRSPRGREIKKEPGDKHGGSAGSSINKPAVPPILHATKSVRDSKNSPTKTHQPPLPKSPPKEKQGPFKLSFTKSSSGTTKPANRTVLEKLGNPMVDGLTVPGAHSQSDSINSKVSNNPEKVDASHSSSSKNIKRKAADPLDGTLGRSEKISKKSNESISKSQSKTSDKRTESKKEKKSAADRREELMKQLKAVENAIAKKRVKISN